MDGKDIVWFDHEGNVTFLGEKFGTVHYDNLCSVNITSDEIFIMLPKYITKFDCSGNETGKFYPPEGYEFCYFFDMIPFAIVCS